MKKVLKMLTIAVILFATLTATGVADVANVSAKNVNVQIRVGNTIGSKHFGATFYINVENKGWKKAEAIPNTNDIGATFTIDDGGPQGRETGVVIQPRHLGLPVANYAVNFHVNPWDFYIYIHATK